MPPTTLNSEEPVNPFLITTSEEDLVGITLVTPPGLLSHLLHIELTGTLCPKTQ